MDSADPNTLRAQSRVGTWLRGKWHLDRLLGVGGMGAVYEATHRNGKRCAIKVLHPEFSAHDGVRERFLREGHVANKVGHPGAVSVIDDDVNEDGAIFLVMELLDGATTESLATARGGRLPPEEVLRIADGVLDVLIAAHDKGIVHRDLKPENVFVARDGRIHVLDFGIARLHDPSRGARGTRTGETFGTPAYMPPEQALGEWNRVDARTDLWAVGATMFALLTGRLVHEAESLQKVMLSAMTKPPPPVEQVLPGVPREVAEIVDRALAFEQDKRWQSAAEMQRAVRELRASRPVMRSSPAIAFARTAAAPIVQSTVAPVTRDRPAQGRSRVVLMIAAGAVVSVVGVVTFLVLGRGHDATTSGLTTADPGGAAAAAPGPSSSVDVVPQPAGTAAPTSKPASAPTSKPTSAPTSKPTSAPTSKPTSAPTSKPTTAPTFTQSVTSPAPSGSTTKDPFARRN